MVNFNLIEGDYGIDEEKYRRFKDLYFNRLDLTIPEIIKIVGVSGHLKNKFLKRIVEETGLRRRGGKTVKISKVG